jgi:two-component system sensor histidine kinase AlgZ
MLVASVLIVALFVRGSEWRQPSVLLRSWVSIAITTFSIGICHQLIYAVVARRLRDWCWPAWWAGGYHAAVIAVATRAGIEISAQTHQHLLGWASAAELRRMLTPTAYVISAVIVLVAVLVSLNQRRRADAESRIASARQEVLRAQLSALQARTDPHFLFNSLNSVASLIAVDPLRAERAVEQLSALFRYALTGSRRERSSLREEFEIVQQYLDIEALRLGDRLQSELSLPAELAQMTVLPLLLQPLVENAIVHGIAQRREGGKLRVSASPHADGVELLIENDAGEAAAFNGSGGSLRELRERLELRYGGLAALEHGKTSHGYRVRLLLPALPAQS